MRGAALLADLSGFIFPRRCVLCRAVMDAVSPGDVCGGCRGGMHLSSGAACAVCAEPMDGELAGAGVTRCGHCRISPPPYDRALSCLRYEGEARELLHLLKFSGREGLVELFAPLMSARLFREPDCAGAHYLVPVPLHHRRLFRRGFNQAYLLAAAVGRDLGKPVAADVLARVRDTAAQFEHTRAERFRNIRGAFAVRAGEAVEGKHVVLVDDIMTTGATLFEAAKTLKKAGAARVICLVAARA